MFGEILEVKNIELEGQIFCLFLKKRKDSLLNCSSYDGQRFCFLERLDF